MQFKYLIRDKVEKAISGFYVNVSKKWCNTWSEDDVVRSFKKVYNGIITSIEQFPQGRKPTLEKWEKKGYRMTTFEKWCFAYYIINDTVYVDDAIHGQNIHEGFDRVHEIVNEVVRKMLRSI